MRTQITFLTLPKTSSLAELRQNMTPSRPIKSDELTHSLSIVKYRDSAKNSGSWEILIMLGKAKQDFKRPFLCPFSQDGMDLDVL